MLPINHLWFNILMSKAWGRKALSSEVKFKTPNASFLFNCFHLLLSEQIMSADKYPSICLHQMEAIVYIYINFHDYGHCKKDLKDNKHNSLHLGWKYAWIFVLGHYLFLEAHSSIELRSRKTVRFSEQIMLTGKYPSKWRLLSSMSLKDTNHSK